MLNYQRVTWNPKNLTNWCFHQNLSNVAIETILLGYGELPCFGSFIFPMFALSIFRWSFDSFVPYVHCAISICLYVYHSAQCATERLGVSENWVCPNGPFNHYFNIGIIMTSAFRGTPCSFKHTNFSWKSHANPKCWKHGPPLSHLVFRWCLQALMAGWQTIRKAIREREVH